MTTDMTQPRTATSGTGRKPFHARIIACRTQDEGCCIMCADCGTIFTPSLPFSDESAEADNVELSRTLFYHMCAFPSKRTVTRNTVGRNGRTNRRT